MKQRNALTGAVAKTPDFSDIPRQITPSKEIAQILTYGRSSFHCHPPPSTLYKVTRLDCRDKLSDASCCCAV